MLHRHEQSGPFIIWCIWILCTEGKIMQARTVTTNSRSPGFSCPDLSINWHFSAESNFQQHRGTSPACLSQFDIY